MTATADVITRFYHTHLEGTSQDGGIFLAECPFCQGQKNSPVGKLAVVLNPDSFFHGYFRCLSRCVAGGFPRHFGSLLGLDPTTVPGYDPEGELLQQISDFPVNNHNGEMRAYHDQLPATVLERFQEIGVTPGVLNSMQVGYNGRYISYPYIQSDGNCYALRCVFPDRPEDFFWHGDSRFASDPYRLFNLPDIVRCSGGALFLCEGEDNLLALQQLGFPGIAVPHRSVFETIDPNLLAEIHTVFLVTINCGESDSAARELASRIGYKVRLLTWPPGTAVNRSLCSLAKESGKGFRQAVATMIRDSKAFSPFASPEREYIRFHQRLAEMQETAYEDLRSGFDLLDNALEGIHGINVIGGAPKVGKSAFAIQVASQMAERGIPVLYYDFENGRQKIYQRIISRLSRIQVSRLGGELDPAEKMRYREASERFQRMLKSFRVINDRKVTPELMRRHIDFIRHETRSDYTMVVIDSLHKLPFKDLSERRTGIDAWLRQLESIRDEAQVSFLVLSELSRGEDRAYSEEPHLGVFKGSGDIEYSADNAMVITADPVTDGASDTSEPRKIQVWIVASREHSPGPVSSYVLDYPYWGFIEEQ